MSNPDVYDKESNYISEQSSTDTDETDNKEQKKYIQNTNQQQAEKIYRDIQRQSIWFSAGCSATFLPWQFRRGKHCNFMKLKYI